MSLLNVRLNPDDSRKAGALRRTGIAVSDVVRRAIREEYERRVESPRAARRPSEIVAGILGRIPAPARPSPVDATDRRAVRKRIRAKLARRSR